MSWPRPLSEDLNVVKRAKEGKARLNDGLASSAGAMKTVFLNPQSILCGMIRRLAVHLDDDLRHGPGVRHLLEARGLGLTLLLKETGPAARTVSAPLPNAHREAT